MVSIPRRFRISICKSGGEMSKEFYFKIISENEVDQTKIGLVKKVDCAFRNHIRKVLGLELPGFELKWFLPCTEEEYKKNGIYDRILKILHDLGGPESDEKYFVEPDNPCGIYRKKHAFSLRLKPQSIIYLRADLSLIETARTMIHELFHLLQAEVKPDSLVHSELWPAEAERILLKKFQAEGLL